MSITKKQIPLVLYFWNEYKIPTVLYLCPDTQYQIYLSIVPYRDIWSDKCRIIEQKSELGIAFVPRYLFIKLKNAVYNIFRPKSWMLCFICILTREIVFIQCICRQCVCRQFVCRQYLCRQFLVWYCVFRHCAHKQCLFVDNLSFLRQTARQPDGQVAKEAFKEAAEEEKKWQPNR